jgi:hypothetical protein
MQPTNPQRRFQFNLRRLLSAMALLSVALGLLRVAVDSPDNRLAAALAFPVVLGSAIGSLFGRGSVGAVTVVVAYCFLVWILVCRLAICGFIQG